MTSLETSQRTIDLDSLKDNETVYWLSGWDYLGDTPTEDYVPYTDIRLVVNGETWNVRTDPEDGYRSYHHDILVTDDPVACRFVPVPVVFRVVTDQKAGLLSRASIWSSFDPKDDDVVFGINVLTNKPVVVIGTTSASDYYPCSVALVNPAGLTDDASDD